MPENFKCKQCGKCCIKFGPELSISTEDILRWRKENRGDILAWVWIENGNSKYPVGDAWFDPQTGSEVNECPWLSKLPSGKYLCKIYETRPQICKRFSPESSNPRMKKDAEECKCQGLNK